MTDNDHQLERFKRAVDRKIEEAAEPSHQPVPTGGPPPDEAALGDQRSLTEDGRTQDVFSVRDKNSGHGKKTADKWNQ